ncbi:hypothetical protein BKA56DRAFT_97670 [Ilyonectria sp. MPI-CAGE-AT-0026]|nr:hypothetical protein BKA56DRAFT_97670 [Ilyonectria sp. MPI-CAGE-AT-0026]
MSYCVLVVCWSNAPWKLVFYLGACFWACSMLGLFEIRDSIVGSTEVCPQVKRGGMVGSREESINDDMWTA